MNRRTAIKSIAATSASVAVFTHVSEAHPHSPFGLKTEFKSSKRAPIPRKGDSFNESILFSDEATLRQTRQLTSQRVINVKPTYHIKAGFSPDSKYLPFATYNDKNGASALVRANVQTGDCLTLDHTLPGEPGFRGGGALSMIPQTNLIAATVGREIRVYDILSGEKRILVPASAGKASNRISSPVGSTDGKSIIYSRNDTDYRWRRDTHIDPYTQTGVSFIQVDLESGKEEVIFRDDQARSNHVIVNPIDPDLLLIDRDWPRGFSMVEKGFDNALKTRVWVLRISTGELHEIAPQDPCKFAWHANWNYSGTHVYYHGPSHADSPLDIANRDGTDYQTPYKKDHWKHFVGVADSMGNTVWEGHYPVLTYGHTSSHSTKNIILTDNLMTDGFVTGVHWDKIDSNGIPKHEIIVKHNTQLRSGMQPTHAHCQMSDDGKWLSYNSMIRDQANVYVAAI